MAKSINRQLVFRKISPSNSLKLKRSIKELLQNTMKTVMTQRASTRSLRRPTYPRLVIRSCPWSKIWSSIKALIPSRTKQPRWGETPTRVLESTHFRLSRKVYSCPVSSLQTCLAASHPQVSKTKIRTAALRAKPSTTQQLTVVQTCRIRWQAQTRSARATRVWISSLSLSPITWSKINSQCNRTPREARNWQIRSEALWPMSPVTSSWRGTYWGVREISHPSSRVALTSSRAANS